MHNRLRARNEDGFTLVELMVVVAILGILMAIAVPSFLRAEDGAKVRAAQSNARSALSAAKTLFTDAEAYWAGSDAATLARLTSAEPSLGWTAMGGPSPSTEAVSWSSTDMQFIIAVRAKNGDCFYLRDDVSTSDTRGTWYGKTIDNDAASCDADTGTPVWKTSQTTGWPKDTASA